MLFAKSSFVLSSSEKVTPRQLPNAICAAAGAMPYASSAYAARTLPERMSLVTLRKVSMTSS